MEAAFVFKDPMRPLLFSARQREVGGHSRQQKNGRWHLGSDRFFGGTCTLILRISGDAPDTQNTDKVWECLSSSSCVAIDTWNQLGKSWKLKDFKQKVIPWNMPKFASMSHVH